MAMKKIDGRSKTIREILENKKYNIDVYQREYNWKTEHVTTLLDDLENKFMDSYEEGQERTAVQNYPHYFLGSFIISQKEDKTFIIDGQQRLTTLTLLLIHLNNLQKDSDEKVDIKNLIFSERYGKKSFNIDVEERNKLIDNLFKGESADMLDVGGISLKNIKERYNDIVEYFPDGSTLPYFIDWLIDNVDLVEIIAYSDEDAYTIFETMNDRGMSLSPTDMLKGYLIANVTDETQKQEANEIWKKQILKLIDIDKEEEFNFFKAWLRAKHAQTIRERKKGATNKDFEIIGTSFHKWVRENKTELGLKKPNDFYEFVTKQFTFYSNVYEKIWKASINFDKELPYVYYNYQNNFTLQPPLILASINSTDDEKTINKKINLVSKFIEMFIVLRSVNRRTLGYSSISYSIFTLMKEIRDKNLDDLAETLKTKIERMEETLEGLDTFRLHQQNRKFVHFFLARITQFIEEKSGIDSDIVRYLSKEIKNPSEIEHIWADKFEEHKDEFDHEGEFDEMRNRLGDLLLLPGDFNKSYSDLPYEDKLPHYFAQNLLARSLHTNCYEKNPSFSKFISEYDLPFKPYNEFKKEEIIARQELYKKISEKIWDLKGFDEIAKG